MGVASQHHALPQPPSEPALVSSNGGRDNNLVTRTVDNTDTESRDSWDEDEEVEVVEDIQYNHVCGSCDHIIALHKVREVIGAEIICLF